MESRRKLFAITRTIQLRGNAQASAAAQAAALKDAEEQEKLKQPVLWYCHAGLVAIPENLMNAPNAVHLFLQKNDIFRIPESISKMVGLEILDLSFNKINEIPLGISHLLRLQKVWLRNNHIPRLPDCISALSSLEFLDASNNYIGYIPTTFSCFPRLKHLNLSANMLSEIPETIELSTNLLSLQISVNSISVIPDSFTALCLLQELNLSYNKIPAFDNLISWLTALTLLDISGNFADRFLLPDVTLPFLRELYVSDNLISELPASLSSFTSLKIMDFSRNPRLSDFKVSTKNMKDLEMVNLSFCELKEIPPVLTGGTQLKRLLLKGNIIQSIPANITTIKSLEEVDLSFNYIPKVIHEINNLEKLRVFRLTHNLISSLPLNITNLKNLEQLDLRENAFKQGEDIVMEAYLCDLEVLDLSKNNLTHVPHLISQLTTIQKLDLSNNKISFIPPFISKLNKLTSIDAKHNHISTIPDIFDDMTWLKDLCIDNNPLTPDDLMLWKNMDIQSCSLKIVSYSLTDFPQNVSRYTFFRSMNLSGNKITAIPEFLKHFTHLATLDVSKNLISELPDFMSALPLTSFSLEENSMTPAHVKAWYAFVSKSQSLSFSTQGLATLPDCLSKVTTLTELDISQNELTDIPEIILPMKNLVKLSIRGNRISTIPEYITNLARLDNFDTSGNSICAYEDIMWSCCLHKEPELNLCGQNLPVMPDLIQKMPHIVRLNLESNKIIFVPCFISNLVNLEELNLADNFIEWLPYTLGKLTKLKLLNLNNNDLSIHTPDDIPEEILNNILSAEHDDEAVRVTKFVQFLPPALLKSADCVISILGNMKLPSDLIQTFNRALANETKYIEKALLVLGSIRRVRDHDPNLADIYEIAADQQLTLYSHSREENADVTGPQMRKIADLAVKSYAVRLLSPSFIDEVVHKMWSNNANMTEYLMKTKRKSSWWDDGFWMGLAYFVQALRSEFPKFSKSPAAKFYISSLGYMIYLLFLTIYVVNYNQTYSTPVYYMSQSLENIFDPSEVTSDIGFREYLYDTLIPGLYEPTRDPMFLNDESYPSYMPLDSYFKLAGQVQFRQLRVKFRECDTKSSNNSTSQRTNITDESGNIPRCIPPYTSIFEDKSPFTLSNGVEYSYKEDLGSTSFTSSTGISYPGTGYIYPVSADKVKGAQSIAELETNGWMDLRTRVVFIEFLVVNQNTNTFTLVQLVFEFLATGNVVASSKYHVYPNSFLEWKWDDTGSLWENAMFGIQLVLIIYTLGFMLHESHQIIEEPGEYVGNFWNMFDISLITLLISMIALHVQVYLLAGTEKDFNVDSDKNNREFMSRMQIISYYISCQKNIFAILLFMSWGRVLFYFGIHSSFGPMQLVVKYMLKDLFQFIILLIVFFIAFTTAFYAVYGASLKNISSIESSSFMLAVFLFGDGDFDPLQSENPIMAPILYFGYGLTCCVLLMNFLIAILTSTYDNIYRVSQDRYRQLFTSTVLELIQSPLPVPFNILYPITWILYPFWVILKPVGFEILRMTEAAWEDRSRGWFFIWDNKKMISLISNIKIRLIYNLFAEYCDVFGTIYITIWIDYLVFGLMCFVAFIAQIPYYMLDKVRKVISPKSANSPLPLDETDVVHTSFVYCILFFIRMVYLISFVPWLLVFSVRYVIAWKKIRKARESEMSIKKKFRCTEFETDLPSAESPVLFNADESIVSNNTYSSICIVGKDEWKPSKKSLFYFEVTVIVPGWMSIGIVAKPGTKSWLPGTQGHSVGYSARTGDVDLSPDLIAQLNSKPNFNSRKDSLTIPNRKIAPLGLDGEEKKTVDKAGQKGMNDDVDSVISQRAESYSWVEVGDKVGCGVDFDSKLIFFSRNGRLHPKTIPLFSQSVYPAIGLYSFSNAVRVNFGTSPFLSPPQNLLLDDSPYFRDFDPQSLTFGGSWDILVRRVTEPNPSFAIIKFEEKNVSSFFEFSVLNVGMSGSIGLGFVDSIIKADTFRIASSNKSSGFMFDFKQLTIEKDNAPNRNQGSSAVIPDSILIESNAKSESATRIGIGINWSSRTIYATVNSCKMMEFEVSWEKTDAVTYFPVVQLDSFGQAIQYIPSSSPQSNSGKPNVKLVKVLAGGSAATVSEAVAEGAGSIGVVGEHQVKGHNNAEPEVQEKPLRITKLHFVSLEKPEQKPGEGEAAVSGAGVESPSGARSPNGGGNNNPGGHASANGWRRHSRFANSIHPGPNATGPAGAGKNARSNSALFGGVFQPAESPPVISPSASTSNISRSSEGEKQDASQLAKYQHAIQLGDVNEAAE